MKTVAQFAKEQGLTKSRVHQLISELSLSPARVEGAFGSGFIYYLSAEDELKLLQTKRISKPKKD